MKTIHKLGFLGFLLTILAGNAMAQLQPAIQYWRPYDQRGINVFETPKNDTVVYDGLKVRIGAGFAQTYQNLQHSNESTNTTVSLYKMGGGFALAQANFNIDVQLADGVSLNLVSYMSSHHHNEFWVKGGYLQVDKVGFLNSPMLDNLWKNLTLKVGHMEVNYGDSHFRRSDGGQTMWNPWIENNIIDEFTTEIGAELYWQRDGILAMIGVTDGEIQGNVSSYDTPDGANRKPSVYGKLGIDRQLNDDLRVRVTGSMYTTKSSRNNTIFGGDRTGSNYQYVMENDPVSLSGNSFSGRFNPGFRDNVTTYVVNPFIKFHGLEMFSTYEYAYGKNAFENGESTTWGSTGNRSAHQAAGELLYRFGQNEKFYFGGRYIRVSATTATGVNPSSPGMRNDIIIDRTSIGGGWFITPNILFKGEYVNQNYDGFDPTDRFYKGNFKGVVVQGAISF